MMRVVFMGTPDFAAASLAALIEDGGFELAGVFTQPDKPRDRGMKNAFSPVKELALANALPVYQPERLRDGGAYDIIRALAPDVIVVVAYGRILPEDILALPPMGAINVHASLLPKYRGAAPIQYSILNGDEVTGVTTMYLAPELDSGDIIYRQETPIGLYESAGELFDRLAGMGAELLIKTLRAMESGDAPRVPQDHKAASFVRPLDKSICPVDWTKTARSIIKHVCALDPWPAAATSIDGHPMKLWRVESTETTTNKAPGAIVSAGKSGIEVACGNGETVMIKVLQEAGKKRVAAADWLLGHPIKL